MVQGLAGPAQPVKIQPGEAHVGLVKHRVAVRQAGLPDFQRAVVQNFSRVIPSEPLLRHRKILVGESQ